MKTYALAFIVLITGALYSAATPKDPLQKEPLIEEAYIYAYPLVLMDVTKDVMTATPHATSRKAPLNQFAHLREFPNSEFTDIVSPNADTLYSSAWLDLAKEPIILTMPDMGNRYYVFPLYDAWSNVFMSLGSRTSGNKKANYVIAGPNWKGTIPKDTALIHAPTNTVWVMGRIKTNGPKDFAAVNKLQNEFKLTPLSAWGKNYTPPLNTPVKPGVDAKTAPVKQVDNMSAKAFFTRFSDILKQNPSFEADQRVLERFSSIGITPGSDFDASKLGEADQAVRKAKIKIKNEILNPEHATQKNGWNMMLEDIGTYGTDYLTRATTAFGGLGANLPQDAVYLFTSVDADNKHLSGAYNYTIHFENDELPPAAAFWSISMYNDNHFFVYNPINRYAIGDRDNLKFNSDGSLDIFIQNKAPRSDRESNWLPSPTQNFNLIMRIYEPKPELLEGDWIPPPVKKVSLNNPF